MSFPKYPEYKDSGIEWLGEIPSHWNISRFKQVFKERNERSPDGLETLLSVSAYTGVRPRSEIVEEGEYLSRAESLEGYKICHPGDLVMNIMLAWNRGLGFTTFNGIVSPAYCVFEKIDNSDCKFLDYLVRSDECTGYFKAFSTGVIESRLRLYPEIFGQLYASIPPLAEQSAIAVFLDRETAKIDALVAEQEKLIELLKEKRRAVISHAVTKGLDPNVPMKDSGVEWLGEVPEHWAVSPLRRLLVSIEQGSSPQSESSPAPPGEPAIIKLSAIKNGHFDATESKALASMQSIDPRYEVRVNDLLVTRANTLDLVGASCIVHSNIPEKLFLPDLVYRLSLRSELTPQFLNYFFQSSSARSQISADARGSSMTMAKISQGHIKCWWVTLPPRAEQDQITGYLEGENRQFDELMVEAQRAIDLLKERRSALISAAVTGKIDVRGLAEATQ